MQLPLQELVLSMYALEVRLEYERHCIEKEWNIEYRIPHSDDLPCHRHRDEISESDRRSGDHREVESIEVALSDRISSFEIVDEKCPDDPAHDEYDPDDDELAMVDMEHIVLIWILSGLYGSEEGNQS